MAIKILKRLGKPTLMDSAEREYLRNLMRYVRTYHSLVRASLAEVLPGLKNQIQADQQSARDIRSYTEVHRIDTAEVRFDNAEDRLKRLFDEVNAKLQTLYPDSTIRRWAKAMAGNVNSISKKNAVKTAKTVDVDIEPLLVDGKLNPFFQNVVDEQVGLITSIPKSKQATFKNKLVHLITQDASQKTISEMISKHFDSEKVNPRLIARDQVNKLNGSLNKYRQQQMGGKRYTWRTAGDERVRPDHAALDGKIFNWNKPPITDKRTRARNHPGGDFQCRCYAEMVISDIID